MIVVQFGDNRLLQKLFDIFRIVCKTAGRGQSACVDGMVVFGRKSEFYGRGGINNGFQSADIVENVGSDKSVSLRFCSSQETMSALISSL